MRKNSFVSRTHIITSMINDKGSAITSHCPKAMESASGKVISKIRAKERISVSTVNIKCIVRVIDGDIISIVPNN